MENKEKFVLTTPTAIVFGSIVIALAIFFSGNNGASSINSGGNFGGGEKVKQVGVKDSDFSGKPPNKDDHLRGSLNSKIVILEYSDTECPFCKRFHESMKLTVAKYPKEVAWAYRHFPLEIHPKAKKEAEALECATDIGGNNAFWRYADRLFEITPANNKLEESELPKIAEFVGLDVNKFNNCLNSGKYTKKIEEHIQDGLLVGVDGTPHSLVFKDGKMIRRINGAVSTENLELIIKESLGK